MIIDCQQLSELLRADSLAKDCDWLNEHTLRISTAFRYPDTSYIDLFLEQMVDLVGTGGPSPFKGYLLSDLGETLRTLSGRK